MEFDDDTHLCLRCSRTIIGLDNYVSHRQQHCYDYQQSLTIPLLSDNPDRPAENQERNLLNESHSPVSCQDDEHMRAIDFFSNLELQSTLPKADHYASCSGISCDNPKCFKIGKDRFCSQLLENEENFVDKHPSPEDLLAESDINDIASLSLCNAKWNASNFHNILHQRTESESNLEDHSHQESDGVDIGISVFGISSSEINENFQLKKSSNHSLSHESSEPLYEKSNSLNENIIHDVNSNSLNEEGSEDEEYSDSLNEENNSLDEANSFLYKGNIYYMSDAESNDLLNEADSDALNEAENCQVNKLITSHEDKMNSQHQIEKDIGQTSVINQNEITTNREQKCIKPISPRDRNKTELSSGKTNSVKQKQSVPVIKSKRNQHKGNRNGLCKFPELSEQSYMCVLCNTEYPCPYAFIKHLLNATHKNDNYEKWLSEIYRNELLLAHTCQFQCLPCSCYFNNAHELLFHIKSVKHRQKAAQLKNSLICLPCQNECASDELILHFSKFHLKCSGPSSKHPVIIAEMKKNFYCRYCLFRCKDILSEMLQGETSKSLSSIVSAKEILLGLDFCSYGININLLIHKISQKTTDSNAELLCSSEAESSLSKEVSLNCSEHDDSNIKNSSDSVSNCPKNSVIKKMRKKVTCPKCFKYFSKNLIEKHMLCHEESANESALEGQIVTDEMAGVLQCQKCTFFTSSKGSMFRHMKIHDPNRAKPYICKKCGSAQLCKSALKQHMRSHFDSKFKCDVENCPFVSYSENHLNLHMRRRHSNKRPFLCKKCDYAGKFIHELKKHQRSHTGEKPYKCKFCSYSAALSSQLLRHTRLHSGSKPYKCPYCLYTCNSQENLRKHILQTKKHKGKKMYPCQYCDFTCNVFSEYRDHLLKEHSEYFPNMDKDITSSAVAGIYEKDIS